MKKTVEIVCHDTKFLKQLKLVELRLKEYIVSLSCFVTFYSVVMNKMSNTLYNILETCHLRGGTRFDPRVIIRELMKTFIKFGPVDKEFTSLKEFFLYNPLHPQTHGGQKTISWTVLFSLLGVL